MNPFQLIPAKWRATFYLAYATVGLADTSIAAYYGAVGQHVPAWVLGVAGALVPIGSAMGVTALSNATQPEPKA